MGHALNKSIKDFITRMYAMRGYTPYIPGWDNHGMPIESAIIKQNKLNRKAMTVPSSAPPAMSSPSTISMSSATASSAWAWWATGTTPTRPWTPASRPRRSMCSARCTKKGYIYKGMKP